MTMGSDEVGAGIGPHLLRDGRGYVWVRQADGDYVMEGDSPKFSRSLGELRSSGFEAVIGRVEPI